MRGWTAHKNSNLALARAYVKQYAPYLSPTLYGLVPSPVEGLVELAGGPLAVTERLVLYYEPKWVESVSTIVLATGLAHECLHDQLRHVARSKAYRDRKRFNSAGDLFINASMRSQKKTVRRGGTGTVNEPMWEFPEWALMPEQFGFPVGLTADEYYRLLEDYEKKNPPKKTPPGTILLVGNGGDEQNEDEHQHQQGIMAGCCGGVAGNPLSRELESKYDHDKGRSESDCKAIARETARAIVEHMKSSAGRGSLPGSWAELVDISETVFPVPWRAELANVSRLVIGNCRTGGLDFSMRRPSKRSYLRGIRLPGLVSYDPEIFFIVDSSGSMGTPQLSDSLRIISDVLAQTGISKAWFMEADTHGRRDPIQVTTRDLRHVEIAGRGGTDFRPAIELVDEFKPRPQIVFYLTDGDGAVPAMAPRNIHFIWCIVPTPYKNADKPWGRVIVLDDLLTPNTRLDDNEDEIDALLKKWR